VRYQQIHHREPRDRSWVYRVSSAPLQTDISDLSLAQSNHFTHITHAHAHPARHETSHAFDSAFSNSIVSLSLPLSPFRPSPPSGASPPVPSSSQSIHTTTRLRSQSREKAGCVSVAGRTSRLDANAGLAPMSPLGVISVAESAGVPAPANAGCRGHELAGSRGRGGKKAYLMVLPVRRRIHCGIGRFCFWALASLTLVRNDLSGGR
jgi:hypothetical protein